MSARRAYISSLGTTGLLVAAALSMLIVVGALVAFDRWPSHAVAEAEAVPIASDGPDAIRRAAEPGVLAPSRGATAAPVVSAAGSNDVLGDAAERAGHVEQSTTPAAPVAAPAVQDPVVSDLPAPDAAPESPAPAPPARAPASTEPEAVPEPGEATMPAIELPPGPVDPTGGDGLAEATSGLGDTVGGLSPDLGQVVRGTSSEATGTIDTLLAGDQP